MNPCTHIIYLICKDSLIPTPSPSKNKDTFLEGGGGGGRGGGYDVCIENYKVMNTAGFIDQAWCNLLWIIHE